MSNRIRIYMTGVGGQGTLTATTLLAVDTTGALVGGAICQGRSARWGR